MLCFNLEFSDQFDDRFRQMREVSERFVLDLARFSIGTPQQMGRVDRTLVRAADGGYVNWTFSGGHGEIIAGIADCGNSN